MIWDQPEMKAHYVLPYTTGVVGKNWLAKPSQAWPTTTAPTQAAQRQARLNAAESKPRGKLPFAKSVPNRDQAADRAARLAAVRFPDCLRESPAKGLKRQHLYPRVSTLWIPSKCGKHPATVTCELDDLGGLSPEQLQPALAPTAAADTPLGAQHLANAERADWAIQWASEMQHDALDWPDETEPLPPMTPRLFKAALFSFANGAGLGWDGVHP